MIRSLNHMMSELFKTQYCTFTELKNMSFSEIKWCYDILPKESVS